MDKWQPIETAPESGEFLVWNSVFERIACIHSIDGEWYHGGGASGVAGPSNKVLRYPGVSTQWHPMPDSPARIRENNTEREG